MKIKIKFTHPAIKEIFEKFKRKKGKFSIQAFYEALPEELRETIGRLYLRELGKINIKEEIEKTVKELEKLELREKLKDLAAKKEFKKFDLLSRKLKQLER